MLCDTENLLVDPSSPFSGGAILGDRIRMESVALDPGVFIRSLATRGSLGGLSSATRVVADVSQPEADFPKAEIYLCTGGDAHPVLGAVVRGL